MPSPTTFKPPAPLSCPQVPSPAALPKRSPYVPTSFNTCKRSLFGQILLVTARYTVNFTPLVPGLTTATFTFFGRRLIVHCYCISATYSRFYIHFPSRIRFYFFLILPVFLSSLASFPLVRSLRTPLLCSPVPRSAFHTSFPAVIKSAYSVSPSLARCF